MTGPEGWAMKVCAIDLRPGGTWHFVWRHSDGTEMELRGVYREVVRPERLVNTGSWGTDSPETLNTLILSEQDGLTTLTRTDALSLERGPRCGTRHRHEGRDNNELRPARRSPVIDGVRRADQETAGLDTSCPRVCARQDSNLRPVD